MRKSTLLSLVLAVCGTAAFAATEGKRIALVIGNDAYKSRSLLNAVNDARLMQKALTGAGFRVVMRENADKVSMETAAAEFFDAIAPGDTALFFYAGHAVQIENENVLIPVDFVSKTVIEARFRSFSLGMVFETLQRSRAATSIVIIDACRTNPVTQGQQAGLAMPMTKNRELYTAFSTSPNNVAADNPDGKNSWFTEALADAANQPGLTLDDVFTRVRLKVESSSGGSQIPWSQTSLTKKFYFHPPMGANSTNDATMPEKWLSDALRHEQFRNWPAAAELLSRIVKVAPGGNVEKTARAHQPYVQARSEAEAAYQAGNFKLAAEHFQQALRIDPFDIDAAFSIAENALLAEDMGRAIQSLEAIRERGSVAAVTRADAMLKEIGAVEPKALGIIVNTPPQPPFVQALFQSQAFGSVDLKAGHRFANQAATVDYAAVAKLIPPPAPVSLPPPASPKPAAELVATTTTPPPVEVPVDPAALRVEVKSLVASRDLVAEEFGEVQFQSVNPQMTVILDGHPVTRTLPYKLKLPAGKYGIRWVEGAKVLEERQFEVKVGGSLQLQVR